MRQIEDLRVEAGELFELLKALSEEQWAERTSFKSWTVADVVLHLHHSDFLALKAIEEPARLQRIVEEIRKSGKEGIDLIAFTRRQFEKMSGKALLSRWWETFRRMCVVFETTDADSRIAWLGPDMGLKMFVTARQMEVWAHGQSLFDLFHVSRTHTDRLRNIAELGVRTFRWTFANRAMPIPDATPAVVLRAPSGATWIWNQGNESNRIEGDAIAFCQVVTQVRNVADVALAIKGEVASQWMSIAQCFAGAPEDPPAPGVRLPPRQSVIQAQCRERQ